MSIQSLYARISDNNRQINELEAKNRLLKQRIDRMYDEQDQHQRYTSKFCELLASEKNNTAAIQETPNMKIAQALGQDIMNFSTGSKATAAVDGLEQISAIFKVKISESEQELQNNKNIIRNLHDDIDYCRREIARIQEEERREAARRAAQKM